MESERRDDRCIVLVDGEIDLSNADEIGRAIEAAVPSDVTDVVLDLRSTSYLDSSGISLLVRFAERMRSRRQRVRVVTPEGSAVRAVLTIAGLSELLSMSTEIDEA
ncbi:MAG: STAS domain-containing protein [Actinomycetota bacterium]